MTRRSLSDQIAYHRSPFPRRCKRADCRAYFWTWYGWVKHQEMHSAQDYGRDMARRVLSAQPEEAP